MNPHSHKFPLRLLAICVPLLVGTPLLAANELFFSEYVEGSSNNKALEIFNDTAGQVDLAAGAYDVQIYSNGGISPSATIALNGTLNAGDVFVLAHSSADAAILAQADLTNAGLNFNGDDSIVLRKNGTVIDSIGQIGNDPGTEWGIGVTSTADNTLRRKATVTAGDTDASNSFDPATEWDGFATDTFDGLGTHSTTTIPDGLIISRTAPDTVVASWPASLGAEWLLETSADLSDQSWTTVDPPYTASGGIVSFTDSPLVDRKFYRLYKLPTPEPNVLFFSEYVEGSGNNKALEIFNSGSSSENLTAGVYDIQIYSNGGISPSATIALNGTLNAGDVFVLAHSSAAAAILAQADLTNAGLNFNGDDAIVLRRNGTVIDSIGQIGTDPGTEWGIGVTSTADNTLRRKSTVTAGDTDASNSFDPATEWDGFATDNFDGLGAHSLAP